MADVSPCSKPHFTLFPMVPLEIREMIWTKAAPHRVITISEISHDLMIDNLDDSLAMLQNNSVPQFKSSAKTPTILHTSRESRRVALKSYHLLFEGHCKVPFYFNPSTDTIFFDHVVDVNTFTSHCHLPFFVEDMKKIRYLALGSTISTSLSMTPVFGQQFGKFENLESLIIQIGQNFGKLEEFQVRKQLRGHWKTSEEKGGERSDREIVMQNPDIVFLYMEEIRAMGLISSVRDVVEMPLGRMDYRLRGVEG